MTFRYESGLSNVGSYMVSGIPYITGSSTLAANAEDQISFFNVTKTVTVINYGSEPIYAHFNSRADGNVIAGNHYVALLSTGDYHTFNVKCSEIYVSTPASNLASGSYRVVAELTSIDQARMYPLTGSGLTD